MTDPPLDPQARIRELETALRQERERLTVALRRAELFEASCKRAYAMATDARRAAPQTRDPEADR